METTHFAMSEQNYAALRMLIVDDFDNFRATLSRMLAEFGCRQVATVMNASQALKACEDQSFDVILCDYNLGRGANGQQLLETLRVQGRLRRQTLFILISAESSQAIVLSAYDYSPDAYLTKPFTARSLQQRLDRLLRQRAVMLPTYSCLDHDDVEGAIAQAEAVLASGSRYSGYCQRLLGDLYLQTGRVERAESLYTSVLEARPLDWAQVGMSLVKRAQGDLDTSTLWLKKIIDDNPFCLRAYDELKNNLLQQGDKEAAQQVIAQSVEVSPLSMVRQLELAETAADNQDLEVATRAYGRTVKLGEHSCYDRSENHLQYSRMAVRWMNRARLPDAADLVRDGLRVLDNMPRRFTLTDDQQLQARLLEAQLYVAQGDSKRAKAHFDEHDIEVPKEEASLDLQLDRVATMKTLQLDERAEDLLAALVEQYRDDQEALKRIDLWLEQPVSDFNRKLVAQLNNEGIRFYQSNDYARALDSFQRAVRLFPHHVGVQLNLLQALVADMKAHGTTPEARSLCDSLVAGVEAAAQPGSAELTRLRQLQQLMRALRA